MIEQDFYLNILTNTFSISQEYLSDIILDKNQTWYMGLVDYTIVNEPSVVFLKDELLFDETSVYQRVGVPPLKKRRRHKNLEDKVFKNKEEIMAYVKLITKRNFTLTYDEALNKMTLKKARTYGPTKKGILFHPKLANILGFLPNFNYLEKQVTAPFTFDLYGGFRNIYLYSRLLENSYVGDVQSPLLKTIPLIREKLINHKEIINPQYFRIKFNTISNLHIEIRNEYGDYVVKNLVGPTVINLTLHISSNPYK
jgi:hypothetical protein